MTTISQIIGNSILEIVGFGWILDQLSRWAGGMANLQLGILGVTLLIGFLKNVKSTTGQMVKKYLPAILISILLPIMALILAVSTCWILNKMSSIKMSKFTIISPLRKLIIDALDKGYDWVERHPNHPLSKLIFLRISITFLLRVVVAYFFSHPISIVVYMGLLSIFIYNNTKLGSLSDRATYIMALNLSIYTVEHLGIAYSKLLLRRPNLRQHLYFGLDEPLTAEDEDFIRCTDKRIVYPTFYGKSPISASPWGVFFPPFGGKKSPQWEDKNKPKVPTRKMWKRIIQLAADNPAATSGIVGGTALAVTSMVQSHIQHNEHVTQNENHHKEVITQNENHHKETVAVEVNQRHQDRQLQEKMHQKELDMTDRHHHETLALEKELRMVGK
jgi:hypothetical protein